MAHSLYFEALRPYLDKGRRLSHLTSLLSYDIQTAAGRKAIAQEGELAEFYAASSAAMAKEVAYRSLVEKGLKDEKASPMERRLFEILNEQIELMEKVSMEDYSAYLKAISKSEEAWRACRPKDDFEGYLPYFKETVRWSRLMAKARMKEGIKTPYDACLDSYEKGLTSASLDAIIAPLKREILSLLPGVISRENALNLPPIKPYPISNQVSLAYTLLDEIGYDMDAGCLRTSAHPFSIQISRYDSRLTTKYLKEDWRSSLFTILHEGGHCLEFQNKSDEEYDCYLEGAASMAVCETHSRLYENLIGRSEEFAPILKKLCAKHLDPGFELMSERDFYLLLNHVEPSLIRTEADELTYSLHIMVRYEIERDLINGKIECEDVPALWKKKYKSYLGVDVLNDRDGCLQDIHWADGSFGYFPSYLLGNLYGAMIMDKMNDEIGYSDLVRENKLDKILAWLKENDYKNDYLAPGDWIEAVTGEKLTSKHFIAYLHSKYGER
jgi:carboxypeptidase Taq